MFTLQSFTISWYCTARGNKILTEHIILKEFVNNLLQFTEKVSGLKTCDLTQTATHVNVYIDLNTNKLVWVPIVFLGNFYDTVNLSVFNKNSRKTGNGPISQLPI